ncbi:uncharacterized protein LOC112190052 [Rosa chinensis]|uniref:uncharacterized protein LOC112190052 n=1 Tax=Rosa chinensis TaxID=74649 RepID=UPI000D0892C0|nr:uncharacterized protein LOC112190052 [Rosa chinensis]
MSATFVDMPPPERFEQVETVQGKQKYPEDAYEPQITETTAPEIQISELREDQASEIRDDFPGSPIHEEQAKDPEEKEMENEVQFGLVIFSILKFIVLHAFMNQLTTSLFFCKVNFHSRSLKWSQMLHLSKERYLRKRETCENPQIPLLFFRK